MNPSALSVSARELRAVLADRLELPQGQILIGPPSAVAREQDFGSSNGSDVVNLFFYRTEYDGYPADGSSADPAYFRAYCLITAFCIADAGENAVGAGEKELRLLGGVLHHLHAQPFLSLENEASEVVATLQVVPHALSLDDMNHIWATQGEVPYRLSVAYELAVLPAPLAVAVDRQPRVGSLGLGVEIATRAAQSSVSDFQVERAQVNASDPAWSPVLRLVQSGKLRLATSLAVADAATPVRVAVAGAPGTDVELVWERWDREQGWRRLASVADPLRVTSALLDPEAPAPAGTSVDLPSREAGQLQLTARRTWRRADGQVVSLFSNPILISIHAGTA